jgi:hypothetical protein
MDVGEKRNPDAGPLVPELQVLRPEISCFNEHPDQKQKNCRKDEKNIAFTYRKEISTG